MYAKLNLCILFLICQEIRAQKSAENRLQFKVNPAPDGHRCGICPTYFQKICAFDVGSSETFIFDNHCIMDLYNCQHSTWFQPVEYHKCLFFGNFAYVHGFKYEIAEHGGSHVIVKQKEKNPHFII